MKNEVNKALLEKFLDGQCTPAEEEMVMQWLRKDSNKDILNEMEHEWMVFDDKEASQSESNIELPFEELEEKIGKETKVVGLSPWIKVAASIALVAVSSFLLIYFNGSHDDDLITRYAQQGKLSVVTLDDGSKVTLGAGSSISYPVQFASNRQVYLEGEAYFDISSGGEFTVHAGNVAAKTSKSSFNVSAYPEDNEVVVSVLEGEAEVVKGEKTMPLIKLRMPKTLPLTKLVPAVVVKDNEYLAYSKDDNTVSKGEDFDPKEVFAWKEGILYFNNADSAKVMKKLERWYGVNIEVSGCLGQKVFNGEFNNKSIEEILSKISTNARSKLEYSRDGDEVLINGACI